MAENESGWELLDCEEASQYLKINEQTLRRMARKKQVPAFKVGREWRFRRAALDAWMASKESVSSRRLILIVDDDSAVGDFPAEFVKLDESELAGIDSMEGEFRRAILRTRIGLLRELDKAVVALGIQTIEQLDLLTEFGCRLGQGSIFCRPVDLDTVGELLAAQGSTQTMAT